jgi:hypothetical protein
MQLIFHKYTSKFIFPLFSVLLFISCLPKHKFDLAKNKLDEKKMADVLADVLLLESYVNEKMMNRNQDSIASIKMSLYPAILNYHHADSAAFYTTFDYLQAHPKEFASVLHLVDSALNKITPRDTTKIFPAVTIPDNINNLPNFNEQQKALQEEYIKANRERLKDSIVRRYRGFI